MSVRRPHRRRALWLTLAAAVLAGCGSAIDGGPAPSPDVTGPEPTASDGTEPTASPDAAASPGSGPAYVALGDSFAAGPGIRPAQPDSGLCFRAAKNYPQRLARRLEASDLRDVTCSGATTADILTGSRQTDEPQIAAVRPETDLVTLSIGGNDGGLYGRLIQCGRVSGNRDDSPCRDALGDGVLRILARTGDDVADVLREVRDRAPDARVLLVGYLRMVPPGGGCAEAPFADGDLPWLRSVERRLEAVLAQAADDAGASFVSLRSRSVGRHVCAGEQAWVSGASGGGAFPFHPVAEGMDQVAAAIAERLDTAGH